MRGEAICTMKAAAFVPARDSRHRRAAFALCRALLRQGRLIPLGRDVWPTDRGAHPVQTAILQQFRRNKSDTSPRLVLSALTAGYKFLSLFKQAQDPSSHSYAEVASYIQKLSRSNPASTPPGQPRQHHDRRPRPPPLLLQNLAPDGTVTFEPNLQARPLPFSSLREGRRKIPHVVVTSEGASFLRYKKPQPSAMHHLATRHQQVNQAQSRLVQTYRQDRKDDAVAEDHWDRILDQALVDEGLTPSSQNDGEATYLQEIRRSVRWLDAQLDARRLKTIAKTQALLKLVEMEKDMYRAEAPLRLAMRQTQATEAPMEKHIEDSTATGAQELSSRAATPSPQSKPRQKLIASTAAGSQRPSAQTASPRPKERSRKKSDVLRVAEPPGQSGHATFPTLKSSSGKKS